MSIIKSIKVVLLNVTTIEFDNNAICFVFTILSSSN